MQIMHLFRGTILLIVLLVSTDYSFAQLSNQLDPTGVFLDSDEVEIQSANNKSVFSANSDLNQYFSNDHWLSGIDWTVIASLVNSDNELIIGGNFDWFNGEVHLNGVAKFDPDNDTWLPLGEGLRIDRIQQCTICWWFIH